MLRLATVPNLLYKPRAPLMRKCACIIQADLNEVSYAYFVLKGVLKFGILYNPTFGEAVEEAKPFRKPL